MVPGPYFENGLVQDCSNSSQCISIGVTAVLHKAIDVNPGNVKNKWL